MADREFVFGRADVQKLLRDHFVTVAADDWYQRRQNDAVGKFFRAVADQGPRKGAGGSTRQGRYAFTASGKLLGFNNNRDPQRILRMLRESLADFKQLPAGERMPGAVKVPPLQRSELERRFARTPPDGGLLVRVHSRVLDKDKEGGYAACGKAGANQDSLRHNGFGASSDHLWIRAAEVQSFLENVRNRREGTALPPAIATRIARYHLVDNTRGEPPHWGRDEIREFKLNAVPITGRPGALRLSGTFHLETEKGDRGYAGVMEGRLQYEAKSNKITRFDLLAIGDHWGEGRYTPGARPGKHPLGIAFTLGDPGKPQDRVPPQGIRWEQGYYEAEKH